MNNLSTPNQTINIPQTELLIAILQENHSHVESLNTLLQSERELLESRNRQKLLSVIEKKQACLDKISATEFRLEQLLNKLIRAVPDSAKVDFDKNRDGLLSAKVIECIIRFAPKAYQSSLKTRWAILREAISECQALNKINGQIIHKSRANVNALLEMMRGYSAQVDLYHSDGHKERSQEQRVLAKA